MHSYFPRRGVAALAGTVLVSAGLVAAVPAASAAAATPTGPGPIVQHTANQVTADALPTEQIDNGVVWSIAVHNGIAYAGGEFSNVRPPGAAAGTNLTPRANFVAVDLATGNLVTTFAPSFNAQVKAVTVSPDGSTLYVGGSFTTVNGQAHSHIAAFNLATGQLITGFTANTNGAVNTIAATNSTVYAGGTFSSARGQTRTRLAAFRASDGALTAWAPTADNDVDALLVSPDGTRLIVAGAFANINGAQALGSAALDPVTGASLPWALNQTVYSYDSTNPGAILSLTTDGTAVYGTAWNYGAPSNFEGTFSVDPDTGNINWLEDCHGDTYGTYPMNGAVYVVSHEHFCSNVGGFPETSPRTWHRTTAFTTQPTGVLTQNQEIHTGYGNFGGQPSPSMINWFPNLIAGTYTGQSQAAWSIAGNDKYVIEGGEFPTVNGTAQYGLTRFGVPSVAPNKRGPNIGGSQPSVSPTAVVTNGVHISWPTNWDQDDLNLTYSIYRTDRGSTPVYQTTVPSTFWNRPTVSWTDTSVTPGTSYTYYLRTTDPAGNVQRSNNITVTVPATFNVSQYANDVLNVPASHYWRLDGGGGTSTDYDWAGGNNLTLGSTVTPGSPGAINGDSDTAATFDGTATGTAATQTVEPGPDTFSVGAWFTTTTTQGGKIVGFGNAATGTSSNYDRHIYMDNAGHLVFGVYNNATYTITTPNTYNDGQWHQVVGTLSGSGMVLYVDGKKIGTNGGTTVGQPYSGYWRVGGDNLNGWTGQPSSPYFNGAIDDVAVYPSALTLSQVQTQYTDSGRSTGIAPAPTDSYGKAVYGDAPDIYYRMDDASGPSAADTSANDVPGVYSGKEAFQTPSTVTGSNGTAVTFDGKNATLASGQSYNAPSTYSEELWFNTTTTSGGKLIGFGDKQSGQSGSYDRQVYMTNSGQLVFGTFTNAANTITSPAAYNDGAWHYLVATQGADGMHLYVDGQQVASGPVTGAQAYTGYWRIGGDNLNSWPSQPSSNFFNGAIDEVAIYLGELTPAQVSAHLAASPLAPNQPPTASFTKSCSYLACSFDGSASSDPDGTVAQYSWDFGDGTTATGASPQHTYAAGGTYTVALTVTDNDGAANTTTQTVQVAANQPPTASYTYSCTTLTCSFDGSGSSDPDGTVAQYSWDFGDGTTGSGATVTHSFGQAGTFGVKLTVTDDQGATNSSTQQVTVAGVRTYAADTFARTVSGGWGTADTGGAYTVVGAKSLLSVANGNGVMTLGAGNGPAAFLNDVSATGLNWVTDVTTNAQGTGGGITAALLARNNGTSNYRLKLRLLPGGVVHLALAKVINGTQTVLKEVAISGLTYATGDVLRMRFTLTGTSPTTLTGTVWRAGGTEPANPQISLTDSSAGLQTAGSVGIQSLLASDATNAPVAVRYRQYTVTAS